MDLPENIIVAATQNRHKIREIEAITARFGMEIIGRDEAGLPDLEIVEDGLTFEENSYKKAYEIMKVCGRPTIADDSGLEVDCLGGAPGIYSARFAAIDGIPELYASRARIGISLIDDAKAVGSGGESDPLAGTVEQADSDTPQADSNDKDNNRKLMSLIKNIPYEERTGRFVSVITLVFPDGQVISCRGTVEGHVIPEERGGGGFGYDPMFIPEGYDKTFGELPAELKNDISHRANALRLLGEELARRRENK